MEGNTTAEQREAQKLHQGSACSDAAVEHQGSWKRLDVGILPLIGFRLEETEKRSLGPARMVCRQWAAELPQGCTRLDVRAMGPEGWQHRFCGLEELRWVNPDYVGQSWPKLRSLQLSRCRNGDLRMLRDLPGLTSLDLMHCDGITDEGLQELKHVSNLTSLYLYLGLMRGCGRGVTEKCLQELKHFPFLTSLELSSSDKITDAGLKELKHVPRLTFLRLACCDNLTDDGIKLLKHLSNLSYLAMYSTHITDEGLKDLGHIYVFPDLPQPAGLLRHHR